MKKMGAKAVVVALAGVLAIGGAVGGTIAWLTDATEEVKNTFTVGDINITLTETVDAAGDPLGSNSWTGKMVPGAELQKDPTVEVLANSEACWLFLEVTAANAQLLTYSVILDDPNTADVDGWTKLQHTGDGTAEEKAVYYRQVDEATAKAGSKYGGLTGNKVTVANTVTKTQLDQLDGKAAPSISFTAYAVQANAATSAADAWTIAQNGGAPL